MKTSIEYIRGCILEPDIIISLEVVLLPVGILLATSIDIYFLLTAMAPRKTPHPCGMCNTTCGVRSVYCSGCSKWIHCTCVDMGDKLLKTWSQDGLEFLCRTCAYRDDEYNVTDALKRLVIFHT